MKYKSDIFEVVHQSAVEKFKIGAISEARMWEYNEMCLASETDYPAEPNVIREADEIEHAGLAAV